MDSITKLTPLELLAVPLVCFGIACASSIWNFSHASALGTGSTVIRMICIFMFPFDILYAIGTAFSDHHRFSDGVAYWSGVTLPCSLVGLPLAIFGGLFGWHRAIGKPTGFVLVLVGIVLFWVPATAILTAFLRLKELAAEVFIFLFGW